MEVHPANPHKVRVIAESTMKSDNVDAGTLANLTRMGWLPESRITPAPRDERMEMSEARLAKAHDHNTSTAPRKT